MKTTIMQKLSTWDRYLKIKYKLMIKPKPMDQEHIHKWEIWISQSWNKCLRQMQSGKDMLLKK